MGGEVIFVEEERIKKKILLLLLFLDELKKNKTYGIKKL